jgi:FAD:protein FMN transferase
VGCFRGLAEADSRGLGAASIGTQGRGDPEGPSPCHRPCSCAGGARTTRRDVQPRVVVGIVRTADARADFDGWLVNTWTFRAMGTSIHILTDDSCAPRTVCAAATVIRRTFEREELRFSRFRAESELSRINAAPGRSIVLSPSFGTVMRLALDAARSTGGSFDPTVLYAMEAIGYDRDFDEVLAGARGVLRPAIPCGRWRDVTLEDDVLRVPAGVGIDLGGIAKGWTADLAASRAHDAGLPWVLVNAGGDLRIVGDAPTIDVAIEDPDDRGTKLGRLSIREGGLATSSIRSRSWGPGLHHVIDPRTGAPAQTDLLQVTVMAPTCAEAEVAATAALLVGTAAATRAAVAVTDDGRVLVGVPIEEAA